MNTRLSIAALQQRLHRLACRLHESRRLRNDMRALARMDDRELRDLGITRGDFAAFRLPANCCA